jgi:hypothetical protein
MTEVVAKRRFGPTTFVAEEDINGALLVTPGTGGLIKKTTGPTVPVLGVNLYPVRAAATNEDETDAFGNTIHAQWKYPSEAAVAFTGEFKLTFATDAAFGVLLYGAADGKVSTVATGAPRPIGMCIEKLGVTVATNAVGLVRLF